jgi:hypothetical protein
VYGNFGVIGELKEGGNVGNYGLQDKSGNFLDLSGFGKSFENFFQQDKGAQAAFDKVSDLKPGDFAALGGQFAKETVSAMGFFELNKMDPTALSAMMKEAGGPIGPGGPGPGGLELKPEQWAGALGAMNPKDIVGLGNNVVGNAVGSLGSKDFLAIPPTQVLAMLQSTVLNFDPQAVGGLQQNLEKYEGKLDGMLGAMSFGQYKEIDPTAMVGMMKTMNLGGDGFDLNKTALQGKDVASMFGALDPASLKEFGGEKVLGSIKGLQKGDFGDLDAKGALNIFNTVGPQGALGLDNLGGIAGKFDAAGFKELGNQGSFDIVKALEKGDLKALDALGANGVCPILDHSQLGELGAQALASMITGVGAGASDLPADHIQSYLQGFNAGDVGALDKDVAGNLVGAAKDADLAGLSPEVKDAYLSNLGANLLGAGAGGFGAGGAGNTVFNIVPAGAYVGGSLAEVIGKTGAPTLFGGKLFGGSP